MIRRARTERRRVRADDPFFACRRAFSSLTFQPSSVMSHLIHLHTKACGCQKQNQKSHHTTGPSYIKKLQKKKAVSLNYRSLLGITFRLGYEGKKKESSRSFVSRSVHRFVNTKKGIAEGGGQKKGKKKGKVEEGKLYGRKRFRVS